MARELPGGWPLAQVVPHYLLAATVVIAAVRQLADLLGRKPMLLLAIRVVPAGLAGLRASHDLRQLVLAQALQGAGGGGLMTLAMPRLVASCPHPIRRGRYQALLGATYGVSTMLGPPVGGALVQYLSWHWAFWLNVPLAALAWACWR